jgi:uncharacterized membrane protein YeaQ/YmgE (transglycosylase-associated protein family)
MRMDAATKLFTDSTELFLVWVGFGTVVALIAKLILPGKDPGGTIGSVLVGIVGSLIGAASFYFFTGVRITPVSIYGFPVALCATTLLLAMYRVLYSRSNHPVFALFQRRSQVRRRATIVEE